jgi:branched-chain amino acid transport system permease protein
MNKKIGYGILLLVLLIAPFGVYPIFLMKLLCFALFACAFNLLIGYTGLLSFGHAAFFGGAGYITGHALTEWGMPTEIGIVIGTAAGAAIGYVMGSLAIRRQGIYFTMITLALAQMVYFIAMQMKFTGGEDGLQGIPRGTLLGTFDLKNDMTMYYFILVVTVAAFLLILRTIHSPFGQVLKAIKENEQRATSLGYDVSKYKLLAFVLSAALTGLAGSLKSVVLGLESLVDVHWAMSGLVILMTLVGGLGTVAGPLIGAFIIMLLENKLGDIGQWLANVTDLSWFTVLGDSVTMVTGVIFIFCVLLLRRGVVGEFMHYTRHFKK